MQYKDYYKIMGVSKHATQDEIKRAHRKLARKYHPDVSKEANAEQKFKEVGEAYEVLKDPQKRSAYDRMGSQWQHGQNFTPPPNWNTDFKFSGGTFTGRNTSGFSEFFESLFGQKGSSVFHQSGTNRQFHTQSNDQYSKILIDLEDSYKGVTLSISLQVPEINKEGQITNKLRTLKVKIPKGVTKGQRIRLAGQGGIGQGLHGDLFLEISFRQHRLFQVEGRDVFLELPTAPWEAALGATLKVPTLAGPVELKIPAGSQSGNKLRLNGRGLPGTKPGNQYVVIKVIIPQAENDEQKAFYENMATMFSVNLRSAIEGYKNG
ncbi:MAG: DnaJ domain-containing protein [Methylococcaceae bacterium]|nr:DnaJ domain-containing protein [Methylococcaceae bacterium]